MSGTANQSGRRVFREHVKDYLLDAILKGHLEPGDRVVESRIAQQIGVSQGPVREALRDLELLGFIESEPFRGSRVRKLSSDDLVEIYPIRAALEGVAAREATPRIDAASLETLDECLQAMRKAASEDDPPAHIEADVRFHRTIVELSRNRMLLQMWQSTNLSSSTMITVALAHRSLLELADRHLPIIEALKSGDPGNAEKVMRAHIEELGVWIANEKVDGASPDGEVVAAAPEKSGP